MKEIPVAYSCTRKELGLALYGRFMSQQPKASVVSVINITGFEEVLSEGIPPTSRNARKIKGAVRQGV